MPDERKKHYELNLKDSKLITAEPATIGSNYKTLTNLRYTDTHLQGVQGNTKINTTALSTYLKARNAFHFRKVQPAESHLLVQAYNTGLTASQILQNTTAIPSAGDFSATELWTDSAGALIGSFCDSSDGQMIYCNGVDSCIWGGNEMKVGAFITSTATVADDGSATNPKDFTEKMQNTKTDSESICHVGGGIDSYVKLMLHCDGDDGSKTITDSSTSAHTVTAVGGAQIDTAYKKFGVGSLYFDGTGDYCTVPDSTDWYFAAGDFTIDVWSRSLITATSTYGICGQYADANNYWAFFVNSTLTSLSFSFVIKSSGTIKASYSTSNISSMLGSFKHVELVRNGENLYLFVDGVSKTFTASTAISTNEVPNLAAVLEIGASHNHTYTWKGMIDELRISKGIARHTANFTVPSSPYLPDWRYFLIGSPRPLQGVKFYISSGNTVASTMTGSYFTGSTWASMTLTDNTDTGASLAKTGTVTFSTTVDLAQPRFIEGYFLYWYQFYLDAGEADIYQVTLDAPFQSIIDLWDGVYRDIAAAYKMNATAREDISLKVLKDDYDPDTADTYARLSLMDAYNTGMLEFGFTEKQTGLHFRLPPEYVNTTASTVMSIDYWNGTEYSSVGDITDGTSDSGISFAKSGTVTWNNSSLDDETKTNKMGALTIWSPLSDTSTTESIWGNLSIRSQYLSSPLYFYRVRFDKQLDDSVRLNYVGGITSHQTVSHFKFPIFAQGRILLCCDMSGEKNMALVSSKWKPQVYNGTDSVKVYFGDEGELNCGVEVFSQYGGNLYSMILIFKDTETWVLAGQDIDTWGSNTYPISNSIGCPAPRTLKAITLAQEPALGVNRSLCVWQGTSGIYLSDGRAPIPIHNDIKEYFDRNDSRCIKASMVGDSCGFLDPQKLEYHWLFASGTSATTLNKELIYDIKRNKWFEIDRGTGMYLQCGCAVQDTDGNQYDYGFIDPGYCERLEYGTNFDGNSIVHTLETGDFAPLGLAYVTQLDHLKLLTVAKTTTSNSVTCTVNNDTCTGIDSTGTITSSGTNVSNNDTITIDSKTYTFKTTLTPTEGEVLIGASAAVSLDNLKLAINRTDPSTNDGVKYKCAAAHSTFEATINTDTVQTIQALTSGTAYNSPSITFSTTASTLTLSLLEGGRDQYASHTMSPIKSGYRIANPYFDDKVKGDPYHSFKFTMTTTDETIGFEPVGIVATFRALTED